MAPAHAVLGAVADMPKIAHLAQAQGSVRKMPQTRKSQQAPPWACLGTD